jgi:uncharacterized protein
MGHSDTPAQFCRHGEFRRSDERTATIIAFRRPAKQWTVKSGAGVPSAGLSARRPYVGLPQWILLAFLRFYIVFLSPFLGGACKFYPSCSNYAVEAVTKHGVRRGIALAAKRLLRCRPFTKGGFDPVPDSEEWAENQNRASGLRPSASTVSMPELRLLNGRKL